MSYVIIGKPNKSGRWVNVAREYLDRYRALDGIAEVRHEYGGRVVPTSPLILDDPAEVDGYINRNKTWLHESYPDYEWEVMEYDPCGNTLICPHFKRKVDN